MPTNDRIRDKLSQLPHKPGVYLMRDRFGTVIYVGKARALRKRVSQYFHPSRRHGWDLKLAALIEAIEDFDVHVVKSEPEALLLEGKLIKEFKPREGEARDRVVEVYLDEQEILVVAKADVVARLEFLD